MNVFQQSNCRDKFFSNVKVIYKLDFKVQPQKRSLPQPGTIFYQLYAERFSVSFQTVILFFYPFPGQIDASKSLFTYGANESSAAFIDLSYVPMFIDNITWTNDSFRLQAERVCGNNTNCLFDAAVTVDTSYGWTTRRQEENNNQVNRELGRDAICNNGIRLSFEIKR